MDLGHFGDPKIGTTVVISSVPFNNRDNHFLARLGKKAILKVRETQPSPQGMLRRGLIWGIPAKFWLHFDSWLQLYHSGDVGRICRV